MLSIDNNICNVKFMVNSDNYEQTHQIGECLGQILSLRSLKKDKKLIFCGLGPIVIGLIGDLGAGKTTFVQGFSSGLSSEEFYTVSSPSYALVHEYPTIPPLSHIDLYRLSGFDDLESIGYWDYLGFEGIIIIEWANRIPDCLTDEHILITIRDRRCKNGRSFEFIFQNQPEALVQDFSEKIENLVYRELKE